MNAFTRFCVAAYRPVIIGQFMLLTLNFFLTGSARNWMHPWRWPIVGLIAFGLVIQIVANLARRKQQPEVSLLGLGQPEHVTERRVL